MSKYLIQTTEIYRADSEAEAQEIINDAKAAMEYNLTKFSSEKKEVKAKGEIIDEYYKVALAKTFTDIKDPGIQVEISYEI